MRTIWKYPIEKLMPEVTFEVPLLARPMFVAIDPKLDLICVWVEVRSEEKRREKMTFMVTGTGHQVPTAIFYLGSVIQGGFVWHFYTDSRPLGR